MHMSSNPIDYKSHSKAIMSSQTNNKRIPVAKSNNSGFQGPSIFIPRVFTDININLIAAKFTELNLGKLERVELHQRINKYGKKRNHAIVHFKRWHENEYTVSIRERLAKGEKLHLSYNGNWLWELREYREAHPIKPISTIDFEDEDNTSNAFPAMTRSTADQQWPFPTEINGSFAISEEDVSHMTLAEILAKHDELYTKNQC